MRKTVKVVDSSALPTGIKASDLAYPKKGRVVEYLTLYRTQRFGWCIATLQISRAKRAGPDRTYGITLEGNIVTMGGGPHILDTKTIYVTEERKEALKKYLDLHTKGMQDAGNIRDRIGSRRAEGQVKRAQGLSSWRWDS